MLWHCLLGVSKGIWPVKNWLVGCWRGYLEWGANLHMAQLMPLPLTVSCFSKIQIGFTFLVPAYPGSPGQRAVNGCVCVCVCVAFCTLISWSWNFILQLYSASFSNLLPMCCRWCLYLRVPAESFVAPMAVFPHPTYHLLLAPSCLWHCSAKIHTLPACLTCYGSWAASVRPVYLPCVSFLNIIFYRCVLLCVKCEKYTSRFAWHLIYDTYI